MKPLFLFLILFASTQLYAQVVWLQQNANYPKALQGFDVEAVNANVAWTIGMTGDYTAQSPWMIGFDGNNFSRTIDGVHWTSGTFPSSGAGWSVNISAIDANVAWIAFQDFGDGSHIFKTIDGGTTWINQPSPINTWIDFVHFWDNAAGLAMGDPDSLGFQIATSGNGGGWARVNPANVPAALPGEFSINDLYSVADNKVWFATNYGRVYYSPNRGITWEVHETGVNATPDGITCGTNGHCLISFGDYSDTSHFKFMLRHSSNFGSTWEDVTPIDDGWVIWGIQFVPNGSNKVIGVFRRNNLAGPFETRVSSDNGLSWQVVDTGTPLLRLDFASPTVGWATEYKTSENPTHIYKYAGDPLVGILSPAPLDAEVKISPNPTTDFIQVELSNAEPSPFWCLLNDAQGRLIRKIEIEKTANFSQKIDLKNLPSGVYTLTVTGKKGCVAKQLVKE